MQESVPLSMPLAVRSRPPLWLRLLPLWLVLLLAVGTVWWWVDSGRVESARAELDGMVLSVAPSYSARVLEVSVRPGQEVRQGAKLSELTAAVMAALNIADDYYKAQEAAESLRGQIREYADEAASLRAENARLKKG